MTPLKYIARIMCVFICFAAFSCGSEHGAGDNDHAGHDHGAEQAHDRDDIHAVEAGHDHEAEDSHDHDAEINHDHEAADHGEEHEHAGVNEAEDGHDHDHAAEGELLPAGEPWEELVGLGTATVEYRSLELILPVPGRIVPNRNRAADVSSFIESSINSVYVNIGDRVREGDALVCLTSPEIGMLRAEYDRAGVELELAVKRFERSKRLYDEEIIPIKTFQEAELAHTVARVNLDYARKKLLALGLSDDEIDNPPNVRSEAVGTTITITAPIDGVITMKDARIGRKVGPDDRLFEIIDLDTVWLEADIFEKDLVRIHNGQKAYVTVTAYDNETFTGTIYHIGDTLDADTRTVKVLVEIDNSRGLLKPGMFAETGIAVGGMEQSLVVPSEAVLEDENLNIVYVRESGGYHRHVVDTGITSGGYIQVLDGLDEGDVVVTTGAFQLKSRTAMSGIDPHAGHNH